MHPTWRRLTAKMHCQAAPYETTNRTETCIILFLNKWMFETEIQKKEGKHSAIKKPSTGTCFWIFYSVHFCGTKKKNFILQCDRLRHVILMELLMLVTVCNIPTSTANPPSCSPILAGTCLCTDVAAEGKHLWLPGWFDISSGMFPLSFTLSFTFTLHFGRTECSV